MPKTEPVTDLDTFWADPKNADKKNLFSAAVRKVLEEKAEEEAGKKVEADVNIFDALFGK